MRSWDALPDRALKGQGRHSRALLGQGLRDYRAAAAHLHELPYGRNSDRADYALVLEERRGTCSTKHALLAAVAAEQSLGVDLVVGIYDMSEANTPGVGPVLMRFGLESLPEAHCYLRLAGERIDVSRSGVSPRADISHFHREWTIEPGQIGEHKLQLHQEFLQRWVDEHAARLPVALRSFEALWQVRERCIGALAQ